MRADGNGGGAVNYEPNSFGGPRQWAAYREPSLRISGDADRYDHRTGNDDYSQPGALFRLMSPSQRAQLLDNIAVAMTGVPEFIQLRQIGHFLKADPAYGQGVAERLGLAGKLGKAAAAAE
jgi:catalase